MRNKYVQIEKFVVFTCAKCGARQRFLINAAIPNVNIAWDMASRYADWALEDGKIYCDKHVPSREIPF